MSISVRTNSIDFIHISTISSICQLLCSIHSDTILAAGICFHFLLSLLCPFLSNEHIERCAKKTFIFNGKRISAITSSVCVRVFFIAQTFVPFCMLLLFPSFDIFVNAYLFVYIKEFGRRWNVNRNWKMRWNETRVHMHCDAYIFMHALHIICLFQKLFHPPKAMT